MKLLREENGERDIQVTLTNGSKIPLAGSGKTVKLALYSDAFYENEDGSLINTTQVANGKVPSHADVTKASSVQYTYTFTGWTDSNNKFYAKNSLPAVTGDMTYTATFSSAVRKYTITWKNEDGSLINTTQVAYGTVPTHSDPTKADDSQYTYTFTGWTPKVVAVTGDAAYTATFAASPKITQGIYIRMGTYKGVPVDWYCAKINTTGIFMYCTSALKSSRFGANATYTTSDIHAWLDIDSGGTFATDLGLTDVDLSLVRTVDLSSTGGDGTDSFILAAYANNEMNSGSAYEKAGLIDEPSYIPHSIWLRTARDASNVRVIRQDVDETVTARYRAATNTGKAYAIRPMFYLDTDAIKNLSFSGSGTKTDPYIFAEGVASVILFSIKTL